MSNPGRIPHLLDEIQALWLRYPHLRFLQLMDIIMMKTATATGKAASTVDDDELLQLGLPVLWREVTAG